MLSKITGKQTKTLVTEYYCPPAGHCFYPAINHFPELT